MSAQEDHDRFRGIAEELGLEDDEADSFVKSSMLRKGYKAITQWADDDSDGKGAGGGDFFSGKRQTKSQRPQAGKRPADRGAGWQYG